LVSSCRVSLRLRVRQDQAIDGMPSQTGLLKGLAAALLELYQPTSLEGLPAKLARMLVKLLGNEFVCFNHVGPGPQDFAAAHEPAVDIGPLAPPLLANLHEHPVWANREEISSAGAIRAISDFLPDSQFKRTTLYNEVYRVLGVDNQLALCTKPEDNAFLVLLINRKNAGFREEERTLMAMLRPHVLQAFQNAKFVSELERENRALNSAVEEPRRAVVLFNAEGKILFRNKRAEICMGRWFESRRASSALLPEPLRRWVSAQLQQPHEPKLDTFGKRWDLADEGRSLSVRLSVGTNLGEYVLLLDEKKELGSAILGTALGLTKREADVLLWVSQGKRNAEIAVILGTRPKTITKHLERIFAKLGVETRTSAANTALELLRR
jgi:DNA-binding CsgD family transcriptional regulator